MLKEVFCLAFLVSTILAANYPDVGRPDFSCDASVMAPSNSIPTSAHAVRFADIKVVGALGDSLTAANGAGAQKNDIFEVALQYRGLAFQIGMDQSLDTHITIPNVLRKFNPDVFGGSIGKGSANVWDHARLNQGIPGAVSGDLVGQAQTLVSLMNEHSEVDVINDWKLVNIFIGANDICAWCTTNGTGDYSAAAFKQHIVDAVQVLKDNLPRTIVSVTGMFDMKLLREVEEQSGKSCAKLHGFECTCDHHADFTDTDMSTASHAYMSAQQEIQDSGMFDTSDDFTFVIQPFLNDVTTPPMKDGKPYLEFFAPDCFHFSKFGHSIAALNLWNTIVQPVGQKQTLVNLSDYDAPLQCPRADCPFFPTTKNSKDCSSFY